MTGERVVLWGLTGVLIGADAVPGGDVVRSAGSAETMTQLKLRGIDVMTVLTGWTEADATAAVGAIGVDRYLDLEVGAYGSDTEDPTELPATALAKLQARYGAAPAGATLITNSTVDAAAASGLGLLVVGISGAASSPDELYANGAKAVFGDLSDIPAVVSAVQGS